MIQREYNEEQKKADQKWFERIARLKLYRHKPYSIEQKYFVWQK
jgi:hypothetical protein